VFDIVVKKAAMLEDIRSGLYIMKEAGNCAEDRSSRIVDVKDVEAAIKKLDEFSIRNKSELDEEIQNILLIIKNNSGKRIGEIFKAYTDKGGTLTYKTFQRKIEKLANGKFITTEKIAGGVDGKTTIIRAASVEKKLSDF
jgi:Cdc6-like AAA superfamily ATPase